MIRLRKECPEIGWGEPRCSPTGNRQVLAVLHQWRDTSLVCVHNLAPAAGRARLSSAAGADAAGQPARPRAQQRRPRGVHQLELEPYAYRWYRLGDPDDALERSLVE